MERYNRSIIKRTTGLWLAILACLLYACEEEEHYDVTGVGPQVFINMPLPEGNTPSAGTVAHTPAGPVGTLKAGFPVNCTYRTTEDIQITCQIDHSLVDLYNQTNHTAYKAVDGALISLFNNGTVTIKRDENLSDDSIKVVFSDNIMDQLTDEAGYLIPVKIGSTSSTIPVNQNKNTVYIKINVKYTNIKEGAGSSAMSGSLITDRSSWVATTQNQVSSGSGANLFDGRTTTWVFGESPFTIDLDMGREYNISGFRWTTQNGNSGAAYAAGGIQVLYSSDNITFSEAGSTSVLALESRDQFVVFYAPLKARYWKLTFIWDNNYRRIRELDAYERFD
ncbi:MAG: BT_3987 domain-containing protein [Mangrovibacterium sp.]